MELLVLWYEAQAAQQRLRNTFRNSSEPNKELTLICQATWACPHPTDYLSVKNRLDTPEVLDQDAAEKKSRLRMGIA
jgi:hypothetical protein